MGTIPDSPYRRCGVWSLRRRTVVRPRLGCPRHFFDRQGRDSVQLLADLLSQQPPEELRRVVEVPLYKRVGALLERLKDLQYQIGVVQ